MKKIVFILLSLMLCFATFTGCSSGGTEKEQPDSQAENCLIGNFYCGSNSETMKVYVIKFYDDNTMQMRYTGFGSKGTGAKDYYATYSVDKGEIEVHYGSDIYYGTILNDGEQIMFGSDDYNLTPASSLKETEYFK